MFIQKLFISLWRKVVAGYGDILNRENQDNKITVTYG